MTARPAPTFAQLFTPKLVTVWREGYGMKELRADLPVILCSAYPEYKQDFGSWASDDYVVKSANLDELKAVVRKHLG